MAVEVASAYITLMPSMKGFQGRMEKEFRGARIGASADKQGESIGKRLTSSIGSSMAKWAKRGAVATGAAVVGFFGTAIYKGFQRLKGIENAEAMMKGLGFDPQQIKGISEQAMNAVLGTVYGFDEAMTVAATATAAGVSDIEGYLGTIADVATLTQRDLDDVGGIFNKIMSRGRVTLEEINQMPQLPLRELIADFYGVHTEAAEKMITDGKVSADDFLKIMEKYEGAADAAGETTTGAFALMNASLARFGVALIEDFFPLLGPIFNGLASMLDNLTATMGPVMEKVATALIGFLTNVYERAVAVFDLFRTGDFTSAFREAFGVEEDSRLVGALLTIREAAIDAFTYMRDEGIPAIQDFFGKLQEAAGWAFDAATSLFDLFINGDFTSTFRETFNIEEDSKIVDFLFNIREAAVDAFDYVTDTVIPAIANFFDEFKNGEGKGGEFRDFLVDLWESFKDIVEYIYDEVLPRLRDLGQWMIDNKGIVAGVAGAFVGLRAAMAVHDLTTFISKGGGVVKVLTDWAKQLKIVQTAQKVWTTLKWLGVGAQKALTAAQRALNKAWLASPIGVIIAGIALLVGAFVLLYKHNEGFRNIVDKVWNYVKDTIASVWENHIKPVFSAIWTWITDTLVPAFVNFYEGVIVPVWAGIWGAIQSAWGFIAPIFMAVAGFVIDVLVVYFRVLMKTAEIVWKTIWAIIKGSWENWILPVFSSLWTWIKDTLIPWFGYLWDKISDVWSFIRDKVTEVWNTYLEPVFSAIWGWIKDTLNPIFQSLWDKVKDVWDKVKNKIVDIWEDHVEPAFDSLKSGVDAVKEAFEDAKDGIRSAWNLVKSIVAKPIVAVIEFVNSGIIGTLNKVLEWAGVTPIDPITVPNSLRVAAANGDYGPGGASTRGGITMATGGILPGYSPGVDDLFFRGNKFDLALAGGEAIMRPEWTRAVGADFVDSMNAAARTGGVEGVKKAMGFANGGVFGHQTGDGQGLWSTLKGWGGKVIGGLTDFFSDPLGFIKRAFDGVMGWLSGDNPLFDVGSKLLSDLISAAPGKIKELAFGNTGVNEDWANFAGAGGLPWQAIWGIVKTLFPDAIKTSDVRNSTVAGYGGKSLHASGRAIDFVLNPWSRMVDATKVLSSLMGWTELIHTPAGRWQQSFGKSFTDFLPITKSQHYDHVHAAMKDGGIMPGLYDDGGWLQPGVSLVANKTGKPEAVFTDEQLNRLGGNTHVTINGVPMDSAGQTADEILYQLRRVDRGKYAARR